MTVASRELFVGHASLSSTYDYFCVLIVVD